MIVAVLCIWESVVKTLWRCAPILVLLLGACSEKPTAAPEPTLFNRDGAFIVVPEHSPLRTKLKIGVVEQRSISEPLTIPGQIEADPGKLVKISSPVAGRIVAIYKRLGDAVKAGDPLLSIDSADVASAFSDHSKAVSALRTAELEYRRQKELSQAEIAARRDVEASEQAFANAKNDVAFARARLSQLGFDPDKPAAAAGRNVVVRSPISGRVVDMTAAAGGYWNDPSQPILTVADLSQVWFSANVQEKDLSRIEIGAAGDIVLNAYPEEPISGKVFSLGEILNPDTRTSTARIALQNSQAHYRPAMFGRVTFLTQHPQALVIPKTALLQNAFDTRVYVEVGPWKFEPRVVKTGVQAGELAQIVSGLKAGDRVVTQEGVTLND